jgi:hypothetical protein
VHHSEKYGATIRNESKWRFLGKRWRMVNYRIDVEFLESMFAWSNKRGDGNFTKKRLDR